MHRPQGRRLGKVKKAGLKKKRAAGSPAAAAAASAAAAAAETREARTLRVSEGIAAAPARWTPAEKRARRAAAAAAAAAEPAEPPAEPPAQPQPAARPAAAHSQHGSHFVTGAVESGRVNDEARRAPVARPPPHAASQWQTTAEAWGELTPLLSHWQEKRVWQPFYYDGLCAEHLRALGFSRVLHEEGVDFFERVREASFLRKVDIIVDNPPYTSAETKDAVLRALVASKLPFCVLMPVSVLFTQLFRDIVPAAGVQLVLPRRVKVCKTEGPPVPFKQMVWIAYRCGLERDLNFVGY